LEEILQKQFVGSTLIRGMIETRVYDIRTSQHIVVVVGNGIVGLIEVFTRIPKFESFLVTDASVQISSVNFFVFSSFASVRRHSNFSSLVNGE
jgi:hypothetical protein